MLVAFTEGGHVLIDKIKVVENTCICQRCNLALYRRNLVCGRAKGQTPFDVFFIGEAPGKSEDMLGNAFVGQSGKMLDRIIQDALLIVMREKNNCQVIPKLSYYITYCVLCYPTNEKHGENREPTKAEIITCRSNILRLYEIANPRAVCFIGKVSEKYYGKEFTLPIRASIQHPSFLLRQGGTQSPWYIYNVQKLSELLRKLYAEN